ncbi:MAG: DUF4249 domain-containing protein [Cyclobacteriaceae bacterium]|nr:DUF4249 domain-containing protein [Cyclobacteriaceae bacterium]
MRQTFSRTTDELRQGEVITRTLTVRRILSRVGIQLIVVIVLLGCLSRINLPVEPTRGRVVISGQVSTIADQNVVELGITAGTLRLPEPLSGASVVVFDDLGYTSTWHEDPAKPGLYKPEFFNAEPGREYFVEVTVPDGRMFKSLPERMPDVVADVEVYHAIEEDLYTDREGTVSAHPFVKVYTNNLLPETPAFLRWSVEECYVIRPTDFPDPFGYVPPPCYILANPDPQRIVLYNGLEQQPGRMDNLLVASRLLDRSFFDRHYFTVYQSSLTREAFDYWRKVDIVANRVGSIFDAPPAMVTGNISSVNDPEEIVLGYFQAVNQTMERFFILPSDLAVPIPYTNCQYRSDRLTKDYAPECLDCLSVRNSSLVRPEWF